MWPVVGGAFPWRGVLVIAIWAAGLVVLGARAALLLVPVVSAVAAAVALGEVPSPWLVPGGALVGAGILRLLGVWGGVAAAPA